MGKDDEMIEMLKNQFLDECNGVVDYLNIAKDAKTKYPDKGYAQIFRDISREERTHKNHLKDILVDMGVEMTDEMKTADANSEEVYKSSFC